MKAFVAFQWVYIQITMAHIPKQQSWKPLAFHKRRLKQHYYRTDYNKTIGLNISFFHSPSLLGSRSDFKIKILFQVRLQFHKEGWTWVCRAPSLFYPCRLPSTYLYHLKLRSFSPCLYLQHYFQKLSDLKRER